VVTIQLTPTQQQRLIEHAAATGQGLEDTLDELLAQPPIPAAADRRRWTPEELELLRNPKNSPRSIARRTGRSVASVSARRYQLSKKDATDAAGA
jgi:hypothetical protein